MNQNFYVAKFESKIMTLFAMKYFEFIILICHSEKGLPYYNYIFDFFLRYIQRISGKIP